MKLFVICLLSALLTIAAESSLLAAQASGNCPKGSVREGSVCVDTETGEIVKRLHLR